MHPARCRALMLFFAAALAACGGSASDGPSRPAGTGEEPLVNLYFWSDYLAPDTLASFEKQTGIKVNISYFDSYQTLEARILTGHSGFDVVLPGSGILGRDIRSGVYLPLDRTRIPEARNLDPDLMSKIAPGDPGNAHAVVYMWSTYGLGFNRKKILERVANPPLTSWRLLLDPAYAAKLAPCGINLIDDPVGVLQIVLQYLGKNPRAPSPGDFAAAEGLLLKLRPYVRTIDTSGEIEALANGDICLSLGYSGDVVQANRRAKEAKNAIELAYFVPDEGSLIGFDLLAIPTDAAHVDNAYKLINYLIKPQVAAAISNAIGYANGNLASKPLLDASIVGDTTIYPTPQERERLVTQTEFSPEQSRTITRIWQRFRTGQ